MSNIYAPGTETEGESFLWYRVDDRLLLGVAFLWKQQSLRALGNYELIKETRQTPNLKVGFGFQGTGTGNPGYYVTSEKNFEGSVGNTNVYLGVGWRSNEDHSHLLGGVKFSPKKSPFTLGVQLDGHFAHPFVTYQVSREAVVGLYAFEGKKLGVLFSIGF